MAKPLDELYLSWLYGLNHSLRWKDPSKTYWNLFRTMYKKEFVWFIPNDDNRVEDGRDLRFEFMDEEGLVDVDPNWLGLGCSFLEMLIGLSRRLAFEAEGEPRDWFWHLLENLDLVYYTDAEFHDGKDIEEVLDSVIWRTYHYDGRGGLFPLSFPQEDQTHLEIWYQLNAYILELG